MAETKKRGRPKKTETITPVVKDVAVEKKVKKQRDPNELIDVKCIVHGGLNYLTPQGLLIQWDAYGSVVPIEYKELIYMMNTSKRFFEEPWIIMEQEVLEDLHATHFYKNIINYDEIDLIFKKTPEQVKKIIETVPNGTKKLIADRATAALQAGTLDSVKIINVLQTALNIELI